MVRITLLPNSLNPASFGRHCCLRHINMTTICTWNIGGALILDEKTGRFTKFSPKYFGQALLAVDPDVVFLQEVPIEPNTESSEVLREIGAIARLPFSAIYPLSPSHLDRQKEQGVALLSKHKLSDVHVLRFTNPKLSWSNGDLYFESHDKGLVSAKISLDSHLVNLVSAHMLPFHAFGLDMAMPKFDHIVDELDSFLVSEGTLPTLAGIDINYSQPSAVLRKTIDAQFSLTPMNKPTTPHGSMYDYLLSSPHWLLSSCQVIHGLADHYLCVAQASIVESSND